MCGCLSRLSLCGPVMDWRPVQSVPHLSPNDRWDRLQHPRNLTVGLSGYRKWMDGYKSVRGFVFEWCHVMAVVFWLCSEFRAGIQEVRGGVWTAPASTPAAHLCSFRVGFLRIYRSSSLRLIVLTVSVVIRMTF